MSTRRASGQLLQHEDESKHDTVGEYAEESKHDTDTVGKHTTSPPSEPSTIQGKEY